MLYIKSYHVICNLFILLNIKVELVKSDDECTQCKVYTDSLNYWIDKTARWKFEGGDAAWEESKLKSYARSEIRLVEIQEGLCSELKKHKNQCYQIAESAELSLEKWWLHENPPSSDFYSWLCIDTLKHCCPKHHYGENCEPCLIQNNKICNNNGFCDGDGKRIGNGHCVCNKGYDGKYCEKCAKNFYNITTTCHPCDKSCNDCLGPGPLSCIECQKGWKLYNNECIDINECLNEKPCENKQFCTNLEGSFLCKYCDKSCLSCKDSGPSDCLSCKESETLWAGSCINGQTKSRFIFTATMRICLYFGLFIIVIFIFRYSTTVASVIVLGIAVYIYLAEYTSEARIKDLIICSLLSN